MEQNQRSVEFEGNDEFVLGPPLTDGLLSSLSALQSPSLTFYQCLVSALLRETLTYYRDFRFPWGTILLIVVIFFVIIICALTLIVRALSSFAGGAFINWTLCILSAVLLLSSVLVEKTYNERTISFRLESGKVAGFLLGRIDGIFDLRAILAGICLLVGLHVGLLFASPDALGIDLRSKGIVRLSDSFILACDNMARGLLLDTMEMYDLRLYRSNIEHSKISKVVFLALRYMLTAYAILLGLTLMQQRNLKRWLLSLSIDPNLGQLTEWLDRCCASESGLHRKLGDEMLFLMIAEEYLRGEYRLVKALTRQFSSLYVDPDVRRLFRSPEGELIFLPQRGAAQKHKEAAGE